MLICLRCATSVLAMYKFGQKIYTGDHAKECKKAIIEDMEGPKKGIWDRVKDSVRGSKNQEVSGDQPSSEASTNADTEIS